MVIRFFKWFFGVKSKPKCFICELKDQEFPVVFSGTLDTGEIITHTVYICKDCDEDNKKENEDDAV